MQYFYNKDKKGVAHLWEGEDTFCDYLEAFPPNGMTVETNKRMRRVCPSCQSAWKGWMTNHQNVPIAGINKSGTVNAN